VLIELRIRNPLVGVPKDQLIEDVTQFATTHGLNDILPLLQKGALVAQNPHDLDRVDGLEASERADIEMELTYRWRHPRTLYFTIILNSIAAAIQGWDQTGSNGANLSFPQAFGIPDSGPQCTATAAGAALCDKNSWIIGFINSCPYIAIAFLLV
jgi:hypothetical protein